ncbi:hypothetical protein FQN55_002317 [Onygenales sp. PD_40]|nr:hypothetical protein FQN55_002317 [Onygenales sp. PD_40]KAK2781900.1 hypothetical protein FQN52_001300 [Onygenales sp. PD_12]
MSSFTPSEIAQLTNLHRPDLAPFEDLYKHLHAHPELPHQEHNTAATIAAKLREIPNLQVHENIGGTGIAAVLRNPLNPNNENTGPTILLRSELDGLPVLEQTNLPYASHATTHDKLDNNKEKPTMHACGHDMHMVCLLAAATSLCTPPLLPLWHGTLILLYQPAEEHGNGASAMLADGLFNSPRNIPTPDILLAQHVLAARTGSIGMKPGPQMAASDCLKITFHGRGGHGSMPANTIDPIVMAANAVVRLQTVVSRELDTGSEFAVLSVGSLHAGNAANIIPATAEMEVNVRTADEGVRARVLAAIERIVRAEAVASGAEKMPEIVRTLRFPVTVNDGVVTGRLGGTFERVFGAESTGITSAAAAAADAGSCCSSTSSSHSNYVPNWPRSNASEDFTCLGTAVGKPSCFWFFGGVEEEVWGEAERKGTVARDIPVNHSPFFAPVVQPTMRVGADALVAGALTFLGRRG